MESSSSVTISPVQRSRRWMRSSLETLLALFLFTGLISAQRPPRYDYENLPQTGFTCEGRVPGKYYSDPDTDCQMFHVCTKMASSLQDYKFLCPNGTVFDQEHQVCADYYQVVCHANVGTNPLGQIFELFKLSSKESTNQQEFGQVPVRDPEYLGTNNNLGDDFQAEEYNNNRGLTASQNSLPVSQPKKTKTDIFFEYTTPRTRPTFPTTTFPTYRTTTQSPSTVPTTFQTQSPLNFKGPIPTTTSPSNFNHFNYFSKFQTQSFGAVTHPPQTTPFPTTTQPPPPTTTFSPAIREFTTRRSEPQVINNRPPASGTRPGPDIGQVDFSDFNALSKFQNQFFGAVTHPTKQSPTVQSQFQYQPTTPVPFTTTGRPQTTYSPRISSPQPNFQGQSHGQNQGPTTTPKSATTPGLSSNSIKTYQDFLNYQSKFFGVITHPPRTPAPVTPPTGPSSSSTHVPVTSTFAPHYERPSSAASSPRPSLPPPSAHTTRSQFSSNSFSNFNDLSKFQAAFFGAVTHPTKGTTTPTPFPYYESNPRAQQQQQFESPTPRRIQGAGTGIPPNDQRSQHRFTDFNSQTKVQSEFFGAAVNQNNASPSRSNNNDNFNGAKPYSETVAPPLDYSQSQGQSPTRRPSVYQNTFRTTLPDSTTGAPATFQQQSSQFGDDFFTKVSSSHEEQEDGSRRSTIPPQNFERTPRRRGQPRQRDEYSSNKFSKRVENVRFDGRPSTVQQQQQQRQQGEIFNAEASVFPGPAAQSNNFYKSERKEPEGVSVNSPGQSDYSVHIQPKSSPTTGSGINFGRRVRPTSITHEATPTPDLEESHLKVVNKSSSTRQRTVKRLRHRTSTTSTEPSLTPDESELPRRSTTTSTTTTTPKPKLIKLQVKTKTNFGGGSAKKNLNFDSDFRRPGYRTSTTTTTEEPELVTASEDQISRLRNKSKLSESTSSSTTPKPSLGSALEEIKPTTYKPAYPFKVGPPKSKPQSQVKKPSLPSTSSPRSNDESSKSKPDYDYYYYDTDSEREEEYAHARDLYGPTHDDKYGGRKGHNTRVIVRS